MNHTVTAAAAANQLGALAFAVVDRVERVIEETIGFGAAAPAAVVALNEFLADASLDDLRRVVDLTPSGAVRLVDRLEAHGYVTRRRGADRRSVKVSLTAKGRKAAERIRRARAAVLDDVLSALTADDRSALAALHAKILASLTTDLVSARRMCRLCDVDACGHHARTCPVTEARRAATAAVAADGAV